MIHFRFRFKRYGYSWWRHRAARRRLATALPLPGPALQRPNTAVWRRAMYLAPVLLAAPSATLQVGDFMVGEAGDAQLHGHPDIRY